MRFRVLWVDPDRERLMAEQLDPGLLVLGLAPRLGPVVLKRVLSQPRALDACGAPRTDVFVFAVAVRSSVAGVEVGDELELEPGEIAERGS